jgi:two-component system chemotaxis response regulator CheY
MTLNVLIVDDSAVMRTMVTRALRMSGLPVGQVHEAANGREALDLLDDHWVDLATVDLNMAVMTGDELIARLRATPTTADLPILVVSSESSPARIREIEAQRAGFLHKPFSPETLHDAVRQLLDLQHV